MTVPPQYFPYPLSQKPLPDDLRRGLYAPGLLAVLSTVGTVALLSFIVYRMTTWQRHYRTFVGYNQYIVLIMNLLLADLIQAISFLVSFHWIRQDAMLAPSTACISQGFLLNIGDLSSGFFVMAIALHTFYTAVKGRRLEHNHFMWSVIATWGLALVLSIVGPIAHGNKYFVKAGAWCWAGPSYEKDRLALHYIWIFIVQFGTIIIYAAVLVQLKTAMRAIVPSIRAQSDTFAKVDHAARLMVLYPFFYIILTLPLSAGRMWSMAHKGTELPNTYQCVAGALLSSSGFVDAALYTLTRKTLLAGGLSKPIHSHRHHINGKESSKSGEVSLSDLPGGITQTRTVTVTGHVLKFPMDDEEDHRGRNVDKTVYHNFERSSHSPTGSLDPIIGTVANTVSEKTHDKGVKFASDVRVTATSLDDVSDDDNSTKSINAHKTSPSGDNRTEYKDFSRSA
ncbi:hypothetical protein AAFC00_002277 [Neodothiora populina]|uniref:G-protein coupled receptors family 2 profile 2 domain-containing protein n=1 Tax=Neodothiora populina TaxID=2781224 RepID=A0ABR3PGW1_9PEZI